jgi:hypothetical protein
VWGERNFILIYEFNKENKEEIKKKSQHARFTMEKKVKMTAMKKKTGARSRLFSFCFKYEQNIRTYG